MPLNPIPWAADEAFVKKDLRLEDAAIKYLTAISDQATVTPRKLGTGVDLSGQSASTGATQLYLTAIPSGLYRVNYYVEVTQPATVSSSLEVTISWTSQGVAKSYTGAAMTGNTTTTYQFGIVVLRSDENAPITYAITYASSGATAMEYFLGITLEQLDA